MINEVCACIRDGEIYLLKRGRRLFPTLLLQGSISNCLDSGI